MTEITLTVNGVSTTVPAGSTIGDLVRRILEGEEAKGVAVAIDREVIPRSTWESIEAAAGARVEIVTAAAGG